MPQTKAEKIVQALKIRGCKEVTNKSRKYRQFTIPDQPSTFYFVGKSGALRKGKSASQTISLTDLLPRLFPELSVNFTPKVG